MERTLSLQRSEEVCVWIRERLGEERLDRSGLTDMEGALAILAEDLQSLIGAAEARQGRTPGIVRASSALSALRDAAEWGRFYRRHATLRERRLRIEDGLRAASGALVLLASKAELV